MKKIILPLLFFLCIKTIAFGQYHANKEVWFTDIDKALQNPLDVFNLDLSGQSLDSIPAYLYHFEKLEALKLSDNNIREINKELEKLDHLEFLELSGNQIRKVDFARLGKAAESLKELWLRNNKIRKIDASLNLLSGLETLNLGENRISSIDSTIHLRYLTILNLDMNQLDQLPNMVQRTNRLFHFNIYGNNLNSFELSSNFNRLRYLNIGDNPIQDLQLENASSSLKTLILDWINLSHTAFPKLPLSIEILSVEHCQLKQVPETFLTLKRLREFSLIQNEIVTIPQNINALKKLQKIWLGGNDLQGSSLKHLKKLKAEIIL